MYILFSVKDGVFRLFKGSQKVEGFLDFIEDKQWSRIEPISWLQDPGSIQMGVLGYFFKLSYVMKDYHKLLTEDYKLSAWVSYAFFVGATILVGGLLGLVRIMQLHSKYKSQSLCFSVGCFMRGLLPIFQILRRCFKVYFCNYNG